jgi:hypothetical protein
MFHISDILEPSDLPSCISKVNRSLSRLREICPVCHRKRQVTALQVDLAGHLFQVEELGFSVLACSGPFSPVGKVGSVYYCSMLRFAQAFPLPVRSVHLFTKGSAKSKIAR